MFAAPCTVDHVGAVINRPRGRVFRIRIGFGEFVILYRRAADRRPDMPVRKQRNNLTSVKEKARPCGRAFEYTVWN